MQKLLSCGLGVALSVLTSFSAHAQVFETPKAQENFVFGEGNKHLQHILDLQRQVQMLKRLIDHQERVNKLYAASLAIGNLYPLLPNPDRTLCRMVPANLACAQAYEDLYPDFISAYISPAPLVPITPVETTHLTESDSAPEAPVAQAAPPKPYDGYYWTDITCLADKCRAIITPDLADKTARYTIALDETLPDGGVVKSISVNGVVLARDGQTTNLQPAPAESKS